MAYKILIASPVHQKPAVLAEFLSSLHALKSGHLQVDHWFIDDQNEPESRMLLDRYCAEDPSAEVTAFDQAEALFYQRDEMTHYWNDALVDKVAAMKDAIIRRAREQQYDGLFLVDSDLVLHPDTLLQLWDSSKTIISNIFWTSWQKGTDPLPQVWLMDEYAFYKYSRGTTISDQEKLQQANAFLTQLKEPGIYEVGGLGACTLIRREALEAGVRFERLPNVSFWGEDRHFCIRAAALGFSLHVDTRQPAYHIYRDSDLAGVERFKRRQLDGKPDGITISLCMIVKNEADSIERCLRSAEGIADEIILVDTGSTDETKAIAAKFEARIFDFDWIDNFAAARNYAFAQATEDYILWLDADDIIEQQDREKFLRLKTELDPAVDSVMMSYHLSFDAQGKPTVSSRRNRLVKRSRNFKWIGPVHEYLAVSGHVLQSDIAITHRKNKTYTDRNLRIYRNRDLAGEEFSARDVYYYANELRDHAFYQEAVAKYEHFLHMKQGWVEDNIAACLKMADCYAHLEQRDLQLAALFKSMTYDRPRAECCCRLGALFLSEQRYHEAIHWYETATKLGGPPQNGAIVDHAAWTWLPYLQLCVCYDRIGQLEEAYRCNEKAMEYHPTHASMQYNKKYLEEQLAKRGERAL